MNAKKVLKYILGTIKPEKEYPEKVKEVMLMPVTKTVSR